MYQWQEIDATMNKLYKVFCCREDSRDLFSINTEEDTVWVITGQQLLNINFQVT